MSQPNGHAISDVEYDIIVTMSNLLQGSKTLQTYQTDAQQAGDTETAEIFGRIRDSYDGFATELHDVFARMHSQS